MGQATFSNNSTIKISGGGTYFGAGSPITLFSTASNEYAIMTFSSSSAMSFTTNPSIKINSSPIANPANSNTTVYVPPSSSIVYDGNSGSVNITVTWTKFINSP